MDAAENWQSEYLQFLLFVFATVWLMQRGSPESKPADRMGAESDEDRLVGAHAKEQSPPWAKAGGWRNDQLNTFQDPVSLRDYALSADFWNPSLQNGSRSSWPSARWWC